MANAPVTNSSLTQFFDQLLRLQKNAMEIVGQLSELSSSSAEKIIITQEDATGATATYELPTISFLKNEISRLDKNFQSLIGQDGKPVNVRMPDGSYRKIIESQLFKEPATIGTLAVPSTFNKRSNFFLENFLNPLLYVSFDITQYVPFDCEQVAVKRVILNTDTDQKKLFFDSNLKGKNDIAYDSLISQLNGQKISYFVDEDIVSLPVSISRYTGSFDVISFKDEVINTTAPDGALLKEKVRKYQLNTIKYTDNLQNFTNTQTLKLGDRLSVGTSTVYEVQTVDQNTNTITLKISSGSEKINIGVNVLNVTTQGFSIKEVQKAVGFDEREVLFIKPIDKTTNMTTREFSPGVAFFTNELVIATPSGNVTFEQFYKTEVMDFGASLLSLAKEGTIPAVYGETPDAPRLDASNFTVDLVNAQKLDTKSVDDLKKKIAQKNSVSSEIDQLDVSIEKKKQELNTTKFNSDAERRAVQNQLDSLIRDKTSKSNLYASIIKDLSTSAKNLPPSLSSPKYSVRGFFPIPDPKSSPKTGDQSVIAFEISYRYLRVDGTSPAARSKDFIDNTGETVRGYFSPWQNISTEIRQKVYDEARGIYVWADENVQDPESVNINQVDIPITKGEKVELRVRSISEAGWPTNPLKSDWSASQIIPFPEELATEEEVITSLTESLSEQTRVNFNQDLAARGLDLHLSTSVFQKDQYFAHTSDSIASGFFTPEGNRIDLFQKLTEMDNKIAALQAIIEQAKGKLQVSIIDPAGQKFLVSNNSVIDLFAGYYQDIVNTLPVSERKGAIINSMYKLVLENTAASTLQLASKFPGGLDVGLPFSGATATNVDDDYKRRKYDITSVSLASMEASKTANFNKYHAPPFQSSQVLSQYAYVRSTDIGLVNPLVASATGSTGVGPIEANSFYPSTGGSASAFVWNFGYTGGTNTPLGGGDLSDFCIHVAHPLLNDETGPTLASLTFPTGATSTSPAVYSKFVHSTYFNKVASDADGKKQVQYWPTSATGSVNERYPLKMGFYPFDRYLIGSKTCGAYLFLSPTSYADLLVDGTDFRSIRKVDFGEDNAIVIPIIFQFRMTDFFGAGINGTGRIGGSVTVANLTNLFYSKKMGIDVYTKDEPVFSFDVQISAKYKADSPSQTSISPAKNTTLVPTQSESVAKIF